MNGRPRPKPSEELAVILAHCEFDARRVAPPVDVEQLQAYRDAVATVADTVESCPIEATKYAWKWRSILAQASELEIMLGKAIGGTP